MERRFVSSRSNSLIQAAADALARTAGHGGMLDRLDPIAFSAPIFFHLTRYWLLP